MYPGHQCSCPCCITELHTHTHTHSRSKVWIFPHTDEVIRSCVVFYVESIFLANILVYIFEILGVKKGLF